MIYCIENEVSIFRGRAVVTTNEYSSGGIMFVETLSVYIGVGTDMPATRFPNFEDELSSFSATENPSFSATVGPFAPNGVFSELY